MSKLKYTEIFKAMQGEGQFIGTPSIFLRLFGCNRRCPLYGLHKNTVLENGKNPEVVQVIKNIDNYEKFEDLPLVTTGCDTYSSVYPEFKKFAKTETIDEVVDRIINMLPNKKFSINTHLILTGGEPLLPGWQKIFPNLLQQLYNKAELQYVTIETNGTNELTQEFQMYLFNADLDVTFSVSSKLPCSGHSLEESIKPEILNSYYWNSKLTYLKWVVASQEDVEDAKKAYEIYNNGMKYMDHIPIYLMPVGGTTESYYLNNKQVRDIAAQIGWRYSPRLQVEMDGNSWAT